MIALAPWVLLPVIVRLLGSHDIPSGLQDEEELLQRIRPVGEVAYPEDPRVLSDLARQKSAADLTDSSASPPPPVAAAEAGTTNDGSLTRIVEDSPPVERHPGADTFSSACGACHLSGIAGAPRLGDADAWAARVAKGSGQLIRHAIDGFQGDSGFMPAKGGRADLSDQQVADAVRYLLDNATAAAIATPAAEPVAVAATTGNEAAAIDDAGEPAAATSASGQTIAPRRRVERVSLRPQEEPMSGAEVYEHGCYVCHGPGLTGAPRLDDKKEWRRRLRKGREQLYRNALNGFKGREGPMPPKGGYAYLSDVEIEAAVNYMLRNGR